jgi:hypothetical protein
MVPNQSGTRFISNYTYYNSPFARRSCSESPAPRTEHSSDIRNTRPVDGQQPPFAPALAHCSLHPRRQHSLRAKRPCERLNDGVPLLYYYRLPAAAYLGLRPSCLTAPQKSHACRVNWPSPAPRTSIPRSTAYRKPIHIFFREENWNVLPPTPQPNGYICRPQP